MRDAYDTVGLKEILAFPVYGTAVWLLYVLSLQVGASAATAALSGLVLIAFAAWLYDTVCLTEGRWHNFGVGLSTLAAAVALALVLLVDDGGPSPDSPIAAGEGVRWQSFSEAKFDALRADGKPIFIDFTAAWCITCKVNERIALADPAVVKAFLNGRSCGAQGRLDPSRRRYYAAPRGEWPCRRAALFILSKAGRNG